MTSDYNNITIVIINTLYSLDKDKSKVMRCSRYVNVGRINVRLNSRKLEEMEYFKYPGGKWQQGVDVKGIRNTK